VTTEAERQQEFLDIVLKAEETGDKSKLAAHYWREHFPDWKWWLFGPENPVPLPDDGRDEA
jgi:hypothetical protein